MANVPRDRLDEVRRVLPGLNGPTVVDILDGGARRRARGRRRGVDLPHDRRSQAARRRRHPRDAHRAVDAMSATSRLDCVRRADLPTVGRRSSRAARSLDVGRRRDSRRHRGDHRRSSARRRRRALRASPSDSTASRSRRSRCLAPIAVERSIGSIARCARRWSARRRTSPTVHSASLPSPTISEPSPASSSRDVPIRFRASACTRPAGARRIRAAC